MKLHLRKAVCLQDVRSQQIKQLDTKPFRVRDNIIIKWASFIRWHLNPESTVLCIFIAVEYEQHIPVVGASRRQRLDRECFRRLRIWLGKQRQVSFKVNNNIFDAKWRHINNFKVEHDLSLLRVKSISEVYLQHVGDACDECTLG